MFQRGKLLLAILLLSSSSALGKDFSTTITYTVAPNQSDLSKKEENTGKPDNIGGLHSLIKYISNAINIDFKYIPYSSYNKAIQNTSVYNPPQTPEVFIGAIFDEDKLRQLEFLPYPVYTDYAVIVIDKKFIPTSFQPVKKDLIQTVKNLSTTNNGIITKGHIFNELSNINFKTAENINLSMENVFLNGDFLVTNWNSISDYFEKNKNNPKIQNLMVLRYPNKELSYLIAINKKSKLLTDKFDENNFIKDKIINTLENLINTGEIKNIIKKQ